MDYKEKVIAILNSKELSKEQKEKLEEIFPELKESEDEKIRKDILAFIKREGQHIDKYRWHKWIAWLEKQGEQKSIWHNEDEEPQRDSLILLIMQSGTPIVAKIIEPNHTFNHGERWAYIDDLLEKQGDKDKLIQELGEYKVKYTQEVLSQQLEKQVEQKSSDKIEPKFKVGDWIILTAGELSATLQIVNVDTNKKLYWFNDNSYLPIVDEECLRLWTIQDAKDGDVLYSLDSKQPFIFKHRKTNEQANVYCGINIYGKFFVGNTKDCIITTDKYIPATKEQRDTLMKAMADAGYIFDFDKKELKKIIDESQIKKNLQDNSFRRMFEQNPAWSEEDENNILFLTSIIEECFKNKEKITLCGDTVCATFTKEDVIDRLKSLRPQKQWKPSCEQIIALRWVLNNIPYNKHKEEISGLLDQIKEL